MAATKPYNLSSSSFFWFRIIPGLIAIVIITSPLWSSIFGVYDIILFYLAFTTIYITYKSCQTAITNIIGYRRMELAMARDWSGELKALQFSKLPHPEQLPKDLSELYHVIITPFYKEPFELLDKTFEALANQEYPNMKNVIIVAAVEERGGPEEKKVIARLKKKYARYFYAIWDFYHPFGLPGEIVGDACSNLRWAGQKASEQLQQEGISSDNVIFTKFDSDTRLHPKHVSALTYTYLTNEKRMNTFFGPAILTYSNNYWRVPAITRVFFSTLSLGVLNEWVAEKTKKQAFSCYSANFHILEKADFWDASTGAEDTYFFWNVFLHLDGDFVGEPFFLPATMDAVEGTSFWGALNALYKQQLRWGWGVLIMPMALQGMSMNNRISISKKLSKFAILFRAYNFMLTSGFMIMVAVPLLTILNGGLEYSGISYLLPRIISFLLTASLIFQLPAKYYTWKLYGSPPKDRSVWFKIWWWCIEPFMMFINLWTYYLIPRVQAIYELTIGKKRTKFLVAIEGRMK